MTTATHAAPSTCLRCSRPRDRPKGLGRNRAGAPVAGLDGYYVPRTAGNGAARLVEGADDRFAHPQGVGIARSGRDEISGGAGICTSTPPHTHTLPTRLKLYCWRREHCRRLRRGSLRQSRTHSVLASPSRGTHQVSAGLHRQPVPSRSGRRIAPCGAQVPLDCDGMLVRGVGEGAAVSLQPVGSRPGRRLAIRPTSGHPHCAAA